jgi:hypothetical protein
VLEAVEAMEAIEVVVAVEVVVEVPVEVIVATIGAEGHSFSPLRYHTVLLKLIPQSHFGTIEGRI